MALEPKSLKSIGSSLPGCCFKVLLLASKEADVFVWGYPTHSGPKWLSDVVASLREKNLVDATPAIARLSGLWRSTYQTQFNGYHEIILVCHSMVDSLCIVDY